MHSLIVSVELTRMYCNYLSSESQQKHKKQQFIQKYDRLEMILWTSLKILLPHGWQILAYKIPQIHLLYEIVLLLYPLWCLCPPVTLIPSISYHSYHSHSFDLLSHMHDTGQITVQSPVTPGSVSCSLIACVMPKWNTTASYEAFKMRKAESHLSGYFHDCFKLI